MNFWLTLVGGSVALAAAGPLATHFRVLPPVAGLALLLCGVGIMVVTGGAAAVVAGRNLFAGAPVSVSMMVAMAVAFSVVAGGIAIMPRSKAVLNDVTTDYENPPVLARPTSSSVPWSAAEREKQELAHPGIEALRLDVPLPRARERIREAVNGLPGWRLSGAPDNASTFHVEIESKLFRFVDDMTIRLEADGDATRVDVRSRSRVGEGDLGANAAHIERLFAVLAGGERP